ncbi:hypothetical protein INR76_10825 [Marixanthomonas sp. SCSIO 43207]|uniref:hypothetical protein n=1 Tax=Marixanthomonas sp. SCSIO 43207 TaxID=2779360 RepID=UPI001CA9566F|nr:hypothetical protein [Marixanthomonas sp. SCSIO 43207]UAB80605.1 hypothetical protein INR76_10825 [Marixanthomonas sp. SCSIO 43207]
MNINLQTLKENNPKIKFIEYDDSTKLINPWNDNSVSFSFKKGQKLTLIKNIVFPEQLVAILDNSKNRLEFIYGPIKNDSTLKTRKFNFAYNGIVFNCFFKEASSSLKLLAKSFKENLPESETDYRQLRLHRSLLIDDYYKNLFEDVFIASFYVKGDFKKIDYDLIGLCKSLNFYMSYFDRNTPKILILAKSRNEESYKNPCFNELFDTFPKKINATKIDSTLLDTFMVANQTENVRLKFIFYFQVLEYASYYYLDKRIQSKILKTLNDPEIFDKPEYFSKSLIEEMKDHFSQRDDSLKLEKTITEIISIDDIKNEIEANKEFFSKDLEFEGGLKIKRILSGDNAI